MNKLIVILGQTASGKTDLSIKLAKKFNGEIVSADSRQVYKGMNIGSGKITKKEMQGVPHYLLDISSPKKRFTVAQYQKLSVKTIKKIHKKKKLPFLVGGTGFYIQSVINDIIIPKVKPDWKLRNKLERKSNQELFLMLKKLDPKRAESIDKNNPRRLVRSLEIVLKTGRPIPPLSTRYQKAGNFDVLQLGIKKTSEELKKLIKKRLVKRLKQGMIKEVSGLYKSGISWKRMEEFGLEYRFIAQYLQDKITHEEMINKIQKESENFAKRQMTWFKRDKSIMWVKNYKEAVALVDKFLLI